MLGFRPRLAPTLFMLPVIVVCVALGVWQIQRLHWKERLIAQRESALTAPPVTAPIDPAEAARLEFHRVVATGRFLYDKRILLHAIGAEGGIGFDIWTPLRLEDGRTLFVDRGFIPSELARRGGDAAGDSETRATVRGILRLAPPVKPGWFVPDNTPGQGEWFWPDLQAMAQAEGLPAPASYYIAAEGAAKRGSWPRGRASLPRLPNNHLQYAVTWFSLAAAGIVIYVLSQRGERKRGDGDDEDRIPRT
ncbi:MAG: SURF1 family protein [Thiohalocapsa sp.]